MSVRVSACFVFSSSRHPGSTLFPYTTLFRSRHVGDPHVVLSAPRRSRDREMGHRNRARVGVPFPDPGIFEDRKSTRLNSSHANISYAVFCLKKKNKMQENIDSQEESMLTSLR